jgi:hypothetical protein
MPLAPDGYQFYRNVKDFGAVGDGVTDDTEAINRAVAWYSTSDSTLRCGQTCGSTTVLGALVYFPVGEASHLARSFMWYNGFLTNAVHAAGNIPDQHAYHSVSTT